MQVLMPRGVHTMSDILNSRLTALSGPKPLAPDAWNFKRSGCIQIKRNQVDEGREGKKRVKGIRRRE